MFLLPLALPPVDAAVAALLAAIFAFALTFLVRPLARALAQGLPVIGSAVASFADAAVARVRDAVTPWVDGAIGPLADLVARPTQALDHVLLQLEATIGAVAVQAMRAGGATMALIHAQVFLPLSHAIASLTSWTTRELDQLRRYVDGQVAAAVAYTEREANAARAGAEQTARGLVSQASAMLAGRIASVLDLAHAIGSDVSALKAYVATLATDFVRLRRQVGDLSPAMVGELANRAEKRAESYAAGAIDHLGGVVDAHFAETAARVAGLATEAATFARYLEQCGRPLCEGALPNTQALQGFQGAVDGALLIAFLAAAASDPKGTAKVIADALGGPAREIGDLFRSLQAAGR